MALSIQIKRGLKADLASAGVTAGELKWTTDENGLYIGNGTSNVQLNGGDPAAARDVKFEMDSSYVLTCQLKNSNGDLIGTEQKVNLPLGELVLKVEYVDSIPTGEAHAGEKGLKITLKNGTVSYVPLTDLVDGLVTTSRKVAGKELSADVTAQDIEDACKELTAELKNKTINASNNTISNITAAMFATGTAGAGLTVDGSTLKHSNAVTAVTTATLAQFTYDAQGHITASTAIGLNTAIGATPSDTAILTEKAVSTALADKVDTTRKIAGIDLKADISASDLIGSMKDETVTFTNKTISATNNTISDLSGANFASDKIGRGLSVDTSNVIGHSNTAITAVTTAKLAQIAYDEYGHITSGTAIDLNTAIGATPSDTAVLSEKAINTALGNKVDTTRTVAGKALSADVSAQDIEDACKELTATYKNKTISGADNTITNLKGDCFAASIVGTGLTVDSTTKAINHSNAVTAVTAQTLAKFAYDAQGHVTGSTAIDLNTSIGATPSDTAVLSEKAISTALDGKVDTTRTVAGKALSADVSAQDVEDACKELTATYKNKTIAAGDNTITGLSGANFDSTKIGRGLSSDTSNVIGHSNTAITAVTTAALAKIAYDTYGHITSSTALVLTTSMTATALDTNVLTEKAVDTFVKSGTVEFTNKTFDANGTGNVLKNVEVADFASGVVATTIAAAATASDTVLATEKAIRTELDKHVLIAQGTTASGSLLQVGTTGDLALVSTLDCGTF